MMDDNLSKNIESLILAGYIEVAGIDGSTGEFLYSVTEKFEKESQEIYQKLIEYVNTGILFLWDEGFLNIRVDETGEFLVSITDKCIDIDAVKSLSRDKQELLLFVVEKFYGPIV